MLAQPRLMPSGYVIHAGSVARKVFEVCGVAVAVCAFIGLVTGDLIPWLVGFPFALGALVVVMIRPEVRRPWRRRFRRQ
jgi:predicted Kef-type K+ transport protein